MNREELVKEEIAKRKAFKEKMSADGDICPHCCASPDKIQVHGCSNHGWLECWECGAYSPISPTWDDAMKIWPTSEANLNDHSTKKNADSDST